MVQRCLLSSNPAILCTVFYYILLYINHIHDFLHHGLDLFGHHLYRRNTFEFMSSMHAALALLIYWTTFGAVCLVSQDRQRETKRKETPVTLHVRIHLSIHRHSLGVSKHENKAYDESSQDLTPNLRQSTNTNTLLLPQFRQSWERQLFHLADDSQLSPLALLAIMTIWQQSIYQHTMTMKSGTEVRNKKRRRMLCSRFQLIVVESLHHDKLQRRDEDHRHRRGCILYE